MNEKTLRDVVLALAQLAKDDHLYCAMLGNEIASVRDSLQELSEGKFVPILNRHRARFQEITAPEVRHDASDYDALIELLKSV